MVPIHDMSFPFRPDLLNGRDEKNKKKLPAVPCARGGVGGFEGRGGAAAWGVGRGAEDVVDVVEAALFGHRQTEASAARRRRGQANDRRPARSSNAWA